VNFPRSSSTLSPPSSPSSSGVEDEATPFPRFQLFTAERSPASRKPCVTPLRRDMLRSPRAFSSGFTIERIRSHDSEKISFTYVEQISARIVKRLKGRGIEVTRFHASFVSDVSSPAGGKGKGSMGYVPFSRRKAAATRKTRGSRGNFSHRRFTRRDVRGAGSKDRVLGAEGKLYDVE